MLNRKLARDLFRARGLMLAIASIIAVGVMCFVALQSAYRNLSQAKLDYYRQCRMADFWIDVKKIPNSEVVRVADLDGISQVRSRVQFLSLVDLPEVGQPLNALVVSLPDERRSVINDIVLRQGSYFTQRRANEVILAERFARAHRLYPGQTIHVLLNQRRQPLFIVGTAISSEFTYMLGPGALMPDPQQFGVLYLKRSFAEEVFDMQGACNQLVGTLSPDSPVSIRQLSDQVDDLLDEYGVISVTPLAQQSSNQFLSAEIQGLGAFAAVMPVIFLVVAALILNVLMTRLARQQRTVIGTLKAIGFSDWQLFLHFLKLGVVVGILGGVAGGILGYGAASLMMMVYHKFYEFPDLRSGFHGTVHLAGLASSLACAVAGSVVGARAALRLQPAESMRPAPPRQGGKVLLERFATLWSRLGPGWRLTLRGILRNRMRTSIGIISSAMGAGLLVTGFLMVVSQNYLIDFQFYRVQRSDLELVLAKDSGAAAVDEIRMMPAVDLVEPILNVACTLKHGPYQRKTAVTGLVHHSLLTIPRDASEQRVAMPASGLVIGSQLATILHLRVGDLVTMIPARGDKLPVQVAVSQIVDSYVGLVAYADFDFLSRQIGHHYVANAVQIQTSRDPAQINELYRLLKQTPGVESIQNRTRIVQSLQDTILNTQWIFFVVLIGFSGTIFFGTVLNASMVNLAERQSEVATLLAIGYSPWQVGGIFLRESMIVNLLGALLGLPLGWALMRLTVAAMTTDFLRLPFVAQPWVWITTIAVAVLFALLAHTVVQWTILRMNYLDSIKVKE